MTPAFSFRFRAGYPSWLLAFVLLFTSALAFGGQTSLTIVSQPGDFVGRGRTYSFDPTNADFAPYVYFDGDVYLDLHVLNPTGEFSDIWFLNFSQADFSRVVVGSYPNARRYGFNRPFAPGLDVSSLNGCNSITGSFTVLQATYLPNGQIDSFWVIFEQHCEGGEPALFGDYRLNATTFTALSPAQLWIGLKNSDDVGLRLDVRAEVFLNSTANPPVGSGQSNDVSAGSSGFAGALLNTVNLALAGPTALSPGDRLLFRASVRRTCAGGGHTSGTARLWYNGVAIDAGPRRDAGSRFDATINGNDVNYYLGPSFSLLTAAGTPRTSIDRFVDSSSPCPDRPFTPFGTWSVTP